MRLSIEHCCLTLYGCLETEKIISLAVSVCVCVTSGCKTKNLNTNSVNALVYDNGPVIGKQMINIMVRYISAKESNMQANDTCADDELMNTQATNNVPSQSATRERFGELWVEVHVNFL